MNILFFGDSITWGAWDSEGGWVNRIKRCVDQKIISTNFSYYRVVYNVSISGDLTADLLERFELETSNRIDRRQETVFVFAIGTNDAMYDIERKVHRITPTIFQENITSLIKKARKLSSNIIFVGFFPVDDNATIPSSWPQHEIYKNKYVSKYNDLLKSICDDENIKFVDLFSTFFKKKYQKLLANDGLHPNNRGHEQISKVVSKFLEDKKII